MESLFILNKFLLNFWSFQWFLCLFLNDLFLDLDFEIFNIVNVVHQFLKGILLSFEELLNFLFIFLHPLNKLSLTLCLFFELLLLEQSVIVGLLVSEILLVY